MFGYWLEIVYKVTPGQLVKTRKVSWLNIDEIYWFGWGHFYDNLYCFGFGLDTA